MPKKLYIQTSPIIISLFIYYLDSNYISFPIYKKVYLYHCLLIFFVTKSALKCLISGKKHYLWKIGATKYLFLFFLLFILLYLLKGTLYFIF